MKRQILGLYKYVCNCCPGHDKYPGDSYRSRRSKAARARDKKIEHQHARSILKQRLAKALQRDLA